MLKQPHLVKTHYGCARQGIHDTCTLHSAIAQGSAEDPRRHKPLSSLSRSSEPSFRRALMPLSHHARAPTQLGCRQNTRALTELNQGLLGDFFRSGHNDRPCLHEFFSAFATVCCFLCVSRSTIATTDTIRCRRCGRSSIPLKVVCKQQCPLTHQKQSDYPYPKKAWGQYDH